MSSEIYKNGRRKAKVDSPQVEAGKAIRAKLYFIL